MGNTTNFSIEKPSVGGARNSWGGIVNVGIDKLDELLHLAMPIGTIQMYPLSTAPTATLNGGTWLVCDGTALLQANYADLFSLIGITYGNGGNASTHFNLPDFQARVPVGYNVAAIGAGTVGVRSIREMATTADGTEAHILTDTQISKHSHTITDAGHIHPIDPTTTHSHIGDQTGGKTGEASAVISESEHFHGTFAAHQVVDSIWQPGGAGANTGLHGVRFVDVDNANNWHQAQDLNGNPITILGSFANFGVQHLDNSGAHDVPDYPDYVGEAYTVTLLDTSVAILAPRAVTVDGSDYDIVASDSIENQNLWLPFVTSPQRLSQTWSSVLVNAGEFQSLSVYARRISANSSPAKTSIIITGNESGAVFEFDVTVSYFSS